MSSFGLADCQEGAHGRKRLGLLRQPRQKRHAGDLDDILQLQKVLSVREPEVVLAGPRLDRSGGDGVLENAQVAGFVVADLGDALIGVVWQT